MYKVDVYLRVRRAVMVEGKSIREVSREFGLHRDTVRKMLAYSVPPGYRRQTPPRRPKLEPFTGVIDRILEDDLARPRKQRHTAKRIFERLRDEYGYDGGYTTVKDYVREHRRQAREMFVPLSHAPGHAQCDFGEALVVIGGVEQKAHCFVIDLPHSDQRQLVLPVGDDYFCRSQGVIIRYRRCRIDYGSASRITEAKTNGRKDATDGGGNDGDERALGPQVAVRPVAVGDQD